MKRTRWRRASTMIRSAFSICSVSTRLLPSACPLAARNVFAIPPPTRMAWQRDRSASRTSILPETFAPPMIVWNGFAGFSRMRVKASTSRSSSSPATAQPIVIRRWCVMATDLSGFSRGVAEYGIIHFLQTIFESELGFVNSLLGVIGLPNDTLWLGSEPYALIAWRRPPIGVLPRRRPSHCLRRRRTT